MNCCKETDNAIRVIKGDVRGILADIEENIKRSK